MLEQVLQERGKHIQDFISMDETSKNEIRTAAIEKVRLCPGLSVVAGHASFPKKGNNDITFCDVFTEGDALTYKAILYLDTSPDQVFSQRQADNQRELRRRDDSISVENIQKWIQHEKDLLALMCQKHRISFALVKDETDIRRYIVEEILPPLVAEAANNSEKALQSEVHSIPFADVYLLFDGDRTLAPDDTGKLFWDGLASTNDNSVTQLVKKIFQRYETYEFQGFLEVAMLYERQMPNAEYQRYSREIGTKSVALYKAWIEFFSNLPSNVHPVLVSSGNNEIWTSVLQKYRSRPINNKISIIAGNHIGLHSYIVDSRAKATVVTELRQRQRGCTIISFGDSGKPKRAVFAGVHK